MSTTSNEKFLAGLRKCGIIDGAVLKEKLATAGNTDPSVLAKSLVNEGLLTKWQAKYLMSGRTKLRIGNYKLLERLRRDEFGDRFLAMHEQLHRRVEIQILPDQLTSEPKRRDLFTEKAGLAATIDHPNLVHVYDVDQAGGRYFLILEHIEGNTLGERIPAGLLPLDAASIIRQAVSGLTEAHSSGIVHGEIAPRNILVSRKNEIKIQNMLLPSLMNPDRVFDPIKDINDAAKVGRKLLKKISGDAAYEQEPSLAKLDGIFSALQTATADQLESATAMLDEWIATESETPGGSIISAPIVTSPQPETKTSLTPRERLAAKNNEEPAESSTSGIMTAINERPVLYLSIAGLVSLLLIGGLGFLGYSLTRGGDNGSDRSAISASTNDASRNEPVRNRGNKPEGKPPRSDFYPPEELERLQNEVDGQADPNLEPEVKPVESTPDGDADPTAPEDAQSDDAQLDDALPDNAQPVEVAVEAMPDVTPADKATQPPPTESVAALDPQPPTVEPVAAESDTAEPAAVDPVPVEPVVAVVSDEDAKEPFKSLPESTDLPDALSTEAHTIATLYIPSNYLMAAELISNDSISKSRLIFEMARSAVDDQRWEVSVRKKSRDEPLNVAEFWREKNNEFKFAWTPAAAENESSNYLRNCHLRLTGNGEKMGFLTLRDPLVIEKFSLSEEDLSVVAETNLQWLPDYDAIQLEIQNMRYSGLPNQDSGGEMILEPRSCGIKQSAAYFFRSDLDERMMWIEVSPLISKRQLEIHAQAFLNTANGPLTTSVEGINALAESLRLKAEQVNAYATDISAATKPDEMTKTKFEEMQVQARKDAKAASKLSEIATEKQNMLPAVTQNNLPFVVYFELEGIRTKLAICNMSE